MGTIQLGRHFSIRTSFFLTISLLMIWFPTTVETERAIRQCSWPLVICVLPSLTRGKVEQEKWWGLWSKAVGLQRTSYATAIIAVASPSLYLLSCAQSIVFVFDVIGLHQKFIVNTIKNSAQVPPANFYVSMHWYIKVYIAHCNVQCKHCGALRWVLYKKITME